MDLQRSMIYRIAYNVSNRDIAGRPCVYHGMMQSVWYDVPRAIVDVDGTRWLIRPALLILF